MLWKKPEPTRLHHATAQRQRRDVQGLRAVAVLLVVVDHLLGRPSGGFVGVDVFFVISGFLITGLLLREHERSGRISLVGFYRRRIKRIGPASVVTALVVAATAPLLLAPVRAANVQTDALWAMLSAGNWRMVDTGTDYMHATDALSPLQHFWSLAVEEQFYFVWPLLLIATLSVRLVRRTGRGAAAAVIGALSVASLAWGAWSSASQPTVAYFSTFTRGWELGVGALLACAAGTLGRLPARSRTPLAWSGLAAIAVSAVALDAGSQFPVPGAILPVLGSAAVLASGIGHEARLSPLTNRVAQYVGNLSFSLYLWHFPVIVLLAELLPQRGGRFVLFSVAAMAALAALSYHFVEQPLRSRSWRRPLLPRPSGRILLRSAAVALALLAVAAGVTVTAARTHTPLTVHPVWVTDLVQSPLTSEERSRAAGIRQAVAATTWPALSPSPAQLGSGTARAPEWLKDGCLGNEHHSLPDVVANAERCVYGNPSGSHRLMLIGDSVAISWMPAIRAALGSDWRIDVWTVQQCAAVDVVARRGDGTLPPDCGRLHAQALQRLRATHPDVTVLTTSDASIGRLVSGATGPAAQTEWQRGTAAAVRAMAPLTKQLVVLDGPPDMHSAQDCIAPVSGPRDCLTAVNGAYLAMSRAQRAAVQDIDAANVRYPKTLGWFCTADGVCPSFVGHSPTLADGRHLSAVAAADLAPLMRAALLAQAR